MAFISSDLEALDKVDAAFKDKSSWAKKCIVATASMGKFSADRSIHEYAEKIWNISPVSAAGFED